MVSKAIEALDEYFPKGECQGRGPAMLMLVKWVELLSTEVTRIVDLEKKK